MTRMRGFFDGEGRPAAADLWRPSSAKGSTEQLHFPHVTMHFRFLSSHNLPVFRAFGIL